ncbi:MAG: hypothetical protein BGO51_07710 [Rhodospirillales bacterium 69-11]|nr:fumarylacetoacetate hydrolase family protein [Rhodospirillales bacterium]OJW24271.1 MAG: hypothetical protein BGO51_07710 [Rhodospirillales bacterium 69-11]
MSAYDPLPAAAHLHRVRRAREIVAPLPPAIAPRTEAEGAATQHALARYAGALPPGGFKLGATGRRMQAYLGLSGPAAGFMATSGLSASGATFRCADLVHPGVECELAVRLGRDLPAGPCTPEEAAAAVQDLMAAIELVENRYADLTTVGTPTVIADQVFHSAAVLGAPAGADWRSLDLETLTGRIIIDGQLRDEGVGAELLGSPIRGLAWLAASPVAAAFGGLQAGQVVMLGSVTPPVWLTGPAEVTVSFPPLPPVTLHLT